MQMYCVETTVSNDGTLMIKGHPFQAGDKVEVIVRSCDRAAQHDWRYPLRGTSIRYVDPFGSVAEDEWDALQ